MGVSTGRKCVDDDMVVAVYDDGLHLVLEALKLCCAEVALEHAALHMVKVASTEREDLWVALDPGVVYDDDLHALPPDLEWLVGRAL